MVCLDNTYVLKAVAPKQVKVVKMSLISPRERVGKHNLPHNGKQLKTTINATMKVRQEHTACMYRRREIIAVGAMYNMFAVKGYIIS